MPYCRPPGKARRGPGSAAPAEVVGSKRNPGPAIAILAFRSIRATVHWLRPSVLARRKATAGRAFGALTDPLRSSEFPSLEDGHEENSGEKRGPHRARLDPGPGPTIDKDRIH